MNQQSTFQTLAKSKGILRQTSKHYYQLVYCILLTEFNQFSKSVALILTQALVTLRTLQAIHYGRKSYFRGFMPFIMKSSLLTAVSRVSELVEEKSDKDWSYGDSLSMGIGLLGYSFLYPLQIINLRMSVEVQMQRFYSNVRECISKIKKNQGLKTFYRGYFFSSSLFISQLAFIKIGHKYMQEKGNIYGQWQKIGLLIGLLGLSECLFYPLLTLKKLLQVNGSIGHTNYNFSVFRAAQYNSIASLFRGIGTKMTNLALYSLLYCIALSSEQ